MSKATNIVNPLGDHEEILQRVARVIRKSDSLKWRIFDNIYGRGNKPRTAKEIAIAIGGKKQSVANKLNELAHEGIISRSKEAKQSFYGKQTSIEGLKPKIKRLLDKPSKIESIPTKRSVVTKAKLTEVRVSFPKSLVDVRVITIDEISSFSSVRRIISPKFDMSTISENSFKEGVKSILGEDATFKDWGGETSDLMTTRLRINGKRYSVAFAFKGPGKKGKLVPGSMGKNGDQAQRLFQEAADVFLVQHWTDIDPSVLRLMEQLSVAKSVLTGSTVYYGVIDGKDAARIVEAYPEHFKK